MLKELMMDMNQYKEFLKANADKDYQWLSEQTGKTTESVRKMFRVLGLPPKKVNSQNRDIIENPRVQKTGVEVKHDGAVVINWSEKTIVTMLGEYGHYVCHFSRHAAIQRAYSNEYEGKGSTQSEIAREFDFQHAKAVALYAKLHGFTKSDMGQTDIEFKLGLTPEEAAEENMQALKRRAMKLTQVASWKKVQADADKWNKFEFSVLEPMMESIETYLPTFKYVEHKPQKSQGDDIAVVGISDLHYMKQCFDDNGKETYNRDLTVKALNEANASLITKMKKFGVPKKFIIPAGTDNLHVDGITHTTTAGTPQARQTTGDWEVHIKNYVELFMNMVESYARIAPVELIVMPGNHDYQTSRMLGVLLEVTYRKHPRITVIHKPTAVRIYRQYGNTCLIFAHGEGESLAKQERGVHSKYLAEAKTQGVNLQSIENIVYYHGHVHTQETKDMSGIMRVSFPSLATEDQWHKMAGYVGNKQGAVIDLVSTVTGRSAMFYS